MPVAARTRLAGKVSSKVTPVSEAPAFGLVTVNDNVEVAPAVIVDGLKLLLTLGGVRAGGGKANKVIVEKKAAQAALGKFSLSEDKAVLR